MSVGANDDLATSVADADIHRHRRDGSGVVETTHIGKVALDPFDDFPGTVRGPAVHHDDLVRVARKALQKQRLQTSRYVFFFVPNGHHDRCGNSVHMRLKRPNRCRFVWLWIHTEFSQGSAGECGESNAIRGLRLCLESRYLHHPVRRAVGRGSTIASCRGHRAVFRDVRVRAGDDPRGESSAGSGKFRNGHPGSEDQFVRRRRSDRTAARGRSAARCSCRLVQRIRRVQPAVLEYPDIHERRGFVEGLSPCCCLPRCSWHSRWTAAARSQLSVRLPRYKCSRECP